MSRKHCIEDECDSLAVSRDRCWKHYLRWWRQHRQPQPDIVVEPFGSLAEARRESHRQSMVNYLMRHPDKRRRSQISYSRSSKGRAAQDRARIIRFLNNLDVCVEVIEKIFSIPREEAIAILEYPGNVTWKILEEIISADSLKRIRNTPFNQEQAALARKCSKHCHARD